MNILETIGKLKEMYRDHRGNVDKEAMELLNTTHDNIISTQRLIELANTEGMKELVRQVQDYLMKVDEVVYSEQIPLEQKRDAIAMKRAWTKVLGKLTGAKSRLEVIEKQLNHMLHNQ